MRGSVYLMIESTPNTVALSADRLGGPTATINHYLSADLRATRDSLSEGPPDSTVLNSCPIPSILPPLAPSSCFCLCVSRMRRCFICSGPDGPLKSRSRKWQRCRHQFGVTKEIDFVLNEASAPLSRGVTGRFVVITPLCHSHTEDGGRTTATV